MESRQPLIALLFQHTERSFVPQCQSAISDERWEYREVTSQTIPVKELRGIYEIRANINRSQGNPIDGFDELLTQFETLADTERLKIYRLASEVEPYSWYLVFTDTSIDRLVGILTQPIGEKPL